jgi:hypothetical protein
MWSKPLNTYPEASPKPRHPVMRGALRGNYAQSHLRSLHGEGDCRSMPTRSLVPRRYPTSTSAVFPSRHFQLGHGSLRAFNVSAAGVSLRLDFSERRALNRRVRLPSDASSPSAPSGQAPSTWKEPPMGRTSPSTPRPMPRESWSLSLTLKASPRGCGVCSFRRAPG